MLLAGGFGKRLSSSDLRVHGEHDMRRPLHFSWRLACCVFLVLAALSCSGEEDGAQEQPVADAVTDTGVVVGDVGADDAAVSQDAASDVASVVQDVGPDETPPLCRARVPNISFKEPAYPE